MQTFARRLATTVVIALAVYGAAAAAIARVGFTDHADAADIIVVPGNTVRADGSVSERLQSRLDVALQLFHEGHAPVIFVSGGMGQEGHDEAAAMAAYLVAHGVAASAIVQDPLGVERNGVRVTGTRHARYFELRDAYSLVREVLGYAAYYAKL